MHQQLEQHRDDRRQRVLQQQQCRHSRNHFERYRQLGLQRGNSASQRRPSLAAGCRHRRRDLRWHDQRRRRRRSGFPHRRQQHFHLQYRSRRVIGHVRRKHQRRPSGHSQCGHGKRQHGYHKSIGRHGVADDRGLEPGVGRGRRSLRLLQHDRRQPVLPRGRDRQQRLRLLQSIRRQRHFRQLVPAGAVRDRQHHPLRRRQHYRRPASVQRRQQFRQHLDGPGQQRQRQRQRIPQSWRKQRTPRRRRHRRRHERQ